MADPEPDKKDSVFLKKYYLLAKADIAYIRFILESYDGLAFVRTLEPKQALVEIAYPPERREDAERLLVELQKETGMLETGMPAVKDYIPL